MLHIHVSNQDKRKFLGYSLSIMSGTRAEVKLAGGRHSDSKDIEDKSQDTLRYAKLARHSEGEWEGGRLPLPTTIHPSTYPFIHLAIEAFSRLSVVCIFHMPLCQCQCDCECRRLCISQCTRKRFIKNIFGTASRQKTTSKLIKNLLPSLKNVTPVACRSIRATFPPPHTPGHVLWPAGKAHLPPEWEPRRKWRRRRRRWRQVCLGHRYWKVFWLICLSWKFNL